MTFTVGITPNTLEEELGGGEKENVCFVAPMTPNSLFEVKTQGGLSAWLKPWGGQGLIRPY